MKTATEVTLSEVASVNPPLPKRPAPDAAVSFVPMAAVDVGGRLTAEVQQRPFESVAKGFTPFLRDDVLVAKITPCFQNGKIATARIPTAVGMGSTEFHVVRPDRRHVDPGYLLHFLRLARIRRHGEMRMTGSGGQRRVPASFLTGLRLPLPPLDEQRRIAGVLDAVERLRAKRRKALGLLGELRAQVVESTFDATATEARSWPLQDVGEELCFLTSGSRGWARHYAETGDLFIRIQNVRRDELVLDDVAFVQAPRTAEAKRTRAQPGDVLLSITADLGRTAVVPEGIGDAYVNQHIAILRSETMTPRFLSAGLASSFGQRQLVKKNRDGVKAGLNFSDIRSVRLPVPPRDVQDEFAERLARLDRAESRCRLQTTQLEALFASVESRAFKGEL